jgi:hypothetical protein
MLRTHDFYQMTINLKLQSNVLNASDGPLSEGTRLFPVLFSVSTRLFLLTRRSVSPDVHLLAFWL